MNKAQADHAFATASCPRCGDHVLTVNPAGTNSRWWILGSYLKCGSCQHEFQLNHLVGATVEDGKAEERRAVRGTAHRSRPKHQRRSASGGQYIAADPKPWDTR